MQRAYAGTDFTAEFEMAPTQGPFSSGFASGFQQKAGGDVEATVYDALGRQVQAQAEIVGDTDSVRLTIPNGSWIDGATGYGRIQITRTIGVRKSMELSERFRILPGLARDSQFLDYT